MVFLPLLMPSGGDWRHRRREAVHPQTREADQRHKQGANCDDDGDCSFCPDGSPHTLPLFLLFQFLTSHLSSSKILSSRSVSSKSRSRTSSTSPPCPPRALRAAAAPCRQTQTQRAAQCLTSGTSSRRTQGSKRPSRGDGVCVGVVEDSRKNSSPRWS